MSLSRKHVRSLNFWISNTTSIRNTLIWFGNPESVNTKPSSRKYTILSLNFHSIKTIYRATLNFFRKFPVCPNLNGMRTIFIWFDSCRKTLMVPILRKNSQNYSVTTSYINMSLWPSLTSLLINWFICCIDFRRVRCSSSFKKAVSLKFKVMTNSPRT